MVDLLPYIQEYAVKRSSLLTVTKENVLIWLKSFAGKVEKDT